MNNGVEELEVIIKKIRYKGIVWIPEPVNPKVNAKQNYLVKWLAKNKSVGDIFTLDEFYKQHPKHKIDAGCKHRVETCLSKMVYDKKLIQISNDSFKVNK